MAFNLTKLTFESDEVFNNAKEPVKCEGSSEYVSTYRYSTGTPADAVEGGAVAAYNTGSGKNINFYVNLADTELLLTNETYILIKGYSCDLNGEMVDPNFYGNTLKDKQCGIVPFPSTFISNANIRINKSSQLLEKIDNNAGETTQFKILNNFTREAVETSGDLFFLPAIAKDTAKRDTVGVLSDMSIERVNNNLRRLNNGVEQITKWSKVIPLSLLFSSMSPDIATFVTTLEINLSFYGYDNDWNRYHYKTTASTAKPRTFITNCELMMGTTKLTESGIRTLRTNLINQNITTQFGYDFYSISYRPLNGGQTSIVESNERNLQGCVIGCNSTKDSDGIGTNYSQYSGNKFKSVTFYYGNAVVPGYGDLSLNTNFPKANVEAYALYRKFHNKFKTHEMVSTSLPIDFNFNFAREPAIDDGSELRDQFLLCAPFFLNGIQANHRNINGNDLRLNIICDSETGSTLTICKIRKHYVQITSDLSVYIIE